MKRCHYLGVYHSMVLTGEVHVLLAHALDQCGDCLVCCILWFLDLELRAICVLEVLDNEA